MASRPLHPYRGSEPMWVKELDRPVLKPWLGGWLHPGWQRGYHRLSSFHRALIIVLLGQLSAGVISAYSLRWAVICGAIAGIGLGLDSIRRKTRQ